jgi:alpha-beta hydrolase superfamily lysophospholipase
MISVFHLCEAVAAEAPVKIQLETKDKVILFGLYEKVEKPEAVVILLPMLSKTKASWTKTQEVLAANHFSSFALDLRGHGESISKNGREISWTAFSNKEFSKMLLDVEAAYEFLIQKEGFAPGKVFIIGASIGANTALKFAAEKKSLGGVALLSPGLDYRGVETVPAAKTYGDRPIFYAASREDMSSFETIGHLAQWTPRSTVARLEGMGHGTTMLEKDPLLLDRIILWLKEAASHP